MTKWDVYQWMHSEFENLLCIDNTGFISWRKSNCEFSAYLMHRNLTILVYKGNISYIVRIVLVILFAPPFCKKFFVLTSWCEGELFSKEKIYQWTERKYFVTSWPHYQSTTGESEDQGKKDNGLLRWDGQRNEDVSLTKHNKLSRKIFDKMVC